MTRQYLPTGFYVGQVVIASHGKANYRGRVGYSDSATHVWLPDVGSFHKDCVVPAPKRTRNPFILKH